MTPDASADAAAAVPLVVDLDGTLLRGDLLLESLFVLARRDTARLLALPLWLLRGRAAFKRRLAAHAMPDLATLPYRTDVLDFLRGEKARGRHLVLATAADRSLADAVAQQLGLFDEVLASDGALNLNGDRKRERLVARFGERGFDYLANASVDCAVWRAARRALLAAPSAGLRRRVPALCPVERVFEDRDQGPMRAALLALRPLHWVKNVLVLAPLVLAQRPGSAEALGQVLIAFAAFSLCASSVYLLNDLLDLPYDRRHPHKKDRALAAGRLGIGTALLMVVALLAAALSLGALLSLHLLALVALYYALTLAYSLGLKDIPTLDALVLAVGYALRVAAGAAAIGLAPPAWLLMFCVLLFFSLALIKRYSELALMGARSAAKVHGYRYGDLGWLLAQGTASGYAAVLLLALSLVPAAPERFAAATAPSLLMLLLMFWISHLWLRACRGEIRDDPVLFALRDRASLGLILGMGALAVIFL